MCNCIDVINEKLAAIDANTKIMVPGVIRLDGMPNISTVSIEVEKADKKNRKRPSRIFPTFCPFCGIKY